MTSKIRIGQRRTIAVLAATAMIVTVLGLAFGTVDAGSSVTPQSGPTGKTVNGTFQGKKMKVLTMLFKVDLNGQPSYMFCIDMAETIQFGVTYDEKSWNEASVPHLANIARILSQTNALTTKDPIEIAAAQSAIWHFSDAFELDVANPANDPAVTARYNALVSDAAANPVADEPAGTLKVTPATASLIQGQPAFYDVTTTATSPLTIELSDAAVTAHPATGNVCDTATAITTVDGSRRICLTAAAARSNVRMTLRTTAATVSAGRVFIRPQRQKLIIGKAGAAQSTETVAVSWTGNGRPSVSVTCPASGVHYGAPATFTATATDPDGDAITYAWSVNGTSVAGQTTSQLTITPKAGDRIAVTVTDAVGQTATADASCPGKNPPTVALVCPERLTVDAENTFTATGTDPDGDTLTYKWVLNGTELTATTGPSLTTVIHAGDLLSVTATDSTALSSDTVEASCIPIAQNHPPTVKLVCPEKLVYGGPTPFVATGSDPDGDALTYEWKVNGTVVPGQTAATATLTVEQGDHVTVVAGDGQTSSAAAEVSCSGTTPNRPPTVTLSCPDDLVWGTGTKFEAVGTDPDGDTLTYQWRINGTVVPGARTSTITATLAKGDVISVTVDDGKADPSAPAIGNCSGNSRPKVTLSCPKSVVYGEPIAFNAIGEDADGDALTYVWRVNDVKDELQVMSTAMLTVHAGDRVNVTAVDGHGSASDSRTVQCVGSSRPAVTITCPVGLVWDEPAAFIANGVDPDGDTMLTYTWYLNGQPVPGETGARLTTVVHRDDLLTVTVTNSDGVVSASAGADCSGDHRPTVTLTCPEKLVLGVPVTFNATATDPDGDPLTFEWKINDGVVKGATGASAELTISKGDRVTVSVVDEPGLRATAATSTCAGASKPAVATKCPKIVVFGEPAVFTAVGTDDDGDTLSYAWTVNGTPVAGATTDTVTLTLAKGDVVAVQATDPTGLASASVRFDCTSGTRPKLTVTCPADYVFGQPAVLTTKVEGAVPADLAFTWALNGKVLDGKNGSSITLTLQAGDQIAVTAVGVNGLVAETVGTLCSGKPPTDVPPVPSMPQVLASTVYHAASVAALPVTGGSTMLMVGIALAALAAGLVLVRFGGRRRRHT